MNDSDWLKQAAGALRDEHGGEPPAGVDTRARVLASLHQRERQRRRWAVVAVPLAAVFLFSSAWAASTGRLPRVFQLLSQPAPSVTVQPAPRPAARGLASSPRSLDPAHPSDPADPAADPADPARPSDPAGAASAAVGAAPAAVGASPASSGVPLAAVGAPAAVGAAPAAVGAGAASPREQPAAGAPSQGTAAAAAAGAAGAAAGAGAGAASAAGPGGASVGAGAGAAGAGAAGAGSAGPEALEDRLYREAHQAHFVDRDPARALRAWDAYLRAQKTGRFATEATYNRALTLVRLGRAADARQALEPFAQGRFGAYRQAEAQKLIAAMGAGR